MAKITILFAAMLIAVGSLGYLGSVPAPPAANGAEDVAESVETDGESTETTAKPKRSVTALIPAFIGGILLVCGVVALNEGFRMHAMHGAVLVGLLGMLAGLGRGASGLGKFFAGDPSLNQRSFLFVWLMTIICAVYVGLCVNSFLQARKQRKLAEDQ